MIENSEFKIFEKILNQNVEVLEAIRVNEEKL